MATTVVHGQWLPGHLKGQRHGGGRNGQLSLAPESFSVTKLAYLEFWAVRSLPRLVKSSEAGSGSICKMELCVQLSVLHQGGVSALPLSPEAPMQQLLIPRLVYP